MRRLVLLATSPRVSPGLLSRDAWRAIESADRVLVADPDEALPLALVDDDIAVERIEADSPHERARELVDACSPRDGRGATSSGNVSGAVLWVGSPDGDPGLSDAIAAEVSRLDEAPEVEVLVGSWDVEGGRLLDAVAVMDRLRSPDGCAWVAAQTHASLAPFVLEEAHEVTEALEAVVADPDDAPPTTSPAIAPTAVSPRHQIPRTSSGHSVDAATANASPTLRDSSRPRRRVCGP